MQDSIPHSDNNQPEPENLDRRAFLARTAGWSKAAIGAALFGGALATSDQAQARVGVWVNSRGGRRRGGWVNGRGGWVNRAGSWINGRGGWVNRVGGWVNGRRGGGGWINRRGGGGAWVNGRW